jgi:hypothetical protein
MLDRYLKLETDLEGIICQLSQRLEGPSLTHTDFFQFQDNFSVLMTAEVLSWSNH